MTIKKDPKLDALTSGDQRRTAHFEGAYGLKEQNADTGVGPAWVCYDGSGLRRSSSWIFSHVESTDFWDHVAKWKKGGSRTAPRYVTSEPYNLRRLSDQEIIDGLSETLTGLPNVSIDVYREGGIWQDATSLIVWRHSAIEPLEDGADLVIHGADHGARLARWRGCTVRHQSVDGLDRWNLIKDDDVPPWVTKNKLRSVHERDTVLLVPCPKHHAPIGEWCLGSTSGCDDRRILSRHCINGWEPWPDAAAPALARSGDEALSDDARRVATFFEGLTVSGVTR